MRARGLVLAGLHADPGGPCGRGYEIASAHGGGSPLCTHGPDPAPAGVDVREEVSTSEATSTTVAAGTDVPCIGDGSSGPRVHAIYAVASDRTDRYAALVDSIRAWAGHIQETFGLSANETGGTRDVRFLTEPDGSGGCRVAVSKVELTPVGDDTFTNTISQLRSAGYDRPDRRYLAWVDANVYCGIANMYLDDSPTGNLNDGAAPLWGRVDQGCWGRYSPGSNRGAVEAHELLHTMGGVQDTAPNATPYGHCTDEADVMCYADGPGVTMRSVCPASHEPYFDCRHNDYFHTNPPSGSYLATHWNVADSSFLEVGPDTGPTVVKHRRAVRITRVTRRIRLWGRVRVPDGYGRCRRRVPLRVQRRKADRWFTVAKGTTGLKGGFAFRLPRRYGRYRVVASRVTRGGGAHICLWARSTIIRIRRR